MFSSNDDDDAEKSSELFHSNDSSPRLTAQSENIYSSSTGKLPLRKGKWTSDEEMYANRIIFFFNQGLLDIPAGSTLRCLLSEKLNCDPMRITKKFAGASCIGKQVFQPCRYTPQNAEALLLAKEELSRLEYLFVEKLGKSKGGGSISSLCSESPNMDDDSGSSLITIKKRSSRYLSSDTARAMSKRFMSEPVLSQLATQSMSTTSSVSTWGTSSGSNNNNTSITSSGDQSVTPRNNKQNNEMSLQQRSMSAMDLKSYTEDDHAAGDLLLQFFRQMHQQLPQTMAANTSFNAMSITEEPGGGDIKRVKREEEEDLVVDILARKPQDLVIDTIITNKSDNINTINDDNSDNANLRSPSLSNQKVSWHSGVFTQFTSTSTSPPILQPSTPIFPSDISTVIPNTYGQQQQQYIQQDNSNIIEDILKEEEGDEKKERDTSVNQFSSSSSSNSNNNRSRLQEGLSSPPSF